MYRTKTYLSFIFLCFYLSANGKIKAVDIRSDKPPQFIHNVSHLYNESNLSKSYETNLAKKLNDLNSIDCKWVSEHLSSNEIIIKYSVLHDTSHEKKYVAYIFKHGVEQPILYELCNENTLINLLDSNDDLYNDTTLFSTLITPFLSEISEIKTIYFIPAGILHEISLEYCMEKNGKMFSENYHVFRLSSLSALKRQRKQRDYHRVSIWGGIEYYAEIDGVNAEEYPFIGTFKRCNLPYLDDSYRAAKRIHEETEYLGITSDFYHDAYATEDNFKSQPWNEVDVLLIETHGLILEHPYQESKCTEESAMKKHALALAGVSNTLEGVTLPDSINDGLLTAYEISKLDLSHVDLAIVSACNSAKGEIKEDGVHGLMRGFKLAGVGSLIMATDTIVDYISGCLWIQFFRNMSRGMTKREALLNGIKYIRTMNNGVYAPPKFWTPYILIDGME